MFRIYIGNYTLSCCDDLIDTNTYHMTKLSDDTFYCG